MCRHPGRHPGLGDRVPLAPLPPLTGCPALPLLRLPCPLRCAGRWRWCTCRPKQAPPAGAQYWWSFGEGVRCAALRCAALRCAALRCAALRCTACDRRAEAGSAAPCCTVLHHLALSCNPDPHTTLTVNPHPCMQSLTAASFPTRSPSRSWPAAPRSSRRPDPRTRRWCGGRAGGGHALARPGSLLRTTALLQSALPGRDPHPLARALPLVRTGSTPSPLAPLAPCPHRCCAAWTSMWAPAAWATSTTCPFCRAAPATPQTCAAQTLMGAAAGAARAAAGPCWPARALTPHSACACSPAPARPPPHALPCPALPSRALPVPCAAASRS